MRGSVADAESSYNRSDSASESSSSARVYKPFLHRYFILLSPHSLRLLAEMNSGGSYYELYRGSRYCLSTA